MNSLLDFSGGDGGNPSKFFIFFITTYYTTTCEVMIFKYIGRIGRLHYFAFKNLYNQKQLLNLFSWNVDIVKLIIAGNQN